MAGAAAPAMTLRWRCDATASRLPLSEMTARPERHRPRRLPLPTNPPGGRRHQRIPASRLTSTDELFGKDSPPANLVPVGLDELAGTVRFALKRVQYRPKIVDGCLAETGLVIQPP